MIQSPLKASIIPNYQLVLLHAKYLMYIGTNTSNKHPFLAIHVRMWCPIQRKSAILVNRKIKGIQKRLNG